jgi:prolyl-tRNA synthetase
MEIGPRDMEQEQVVLAKRVRAEDDPRKEFLPEAEALATIPERLDAFQAELLETATARREENSHRGVQTIGELAEIVNGSGGFVYTGWSGDPAVEERIKEETKATLRCIPGEEFRSDEAPTKCIGGDGDATMEVVWARAY